VTAAPIRPAGGERSGATPGKRRGRVRFAIRVLVDFGLPVAAYYVLRTFGAGVYVSLLVGTLASSKV